MHSLGKSNVCMSTITKRQAKQVQTRTQVADRLTALTVASKALDTSLAGKGSAAKLQKAIAKLEKAENPFDPQPKPAAAGTAHAPAAAAPQMPETGQVSAPAPAEASLPSVSHTPYWNILFLLLMQIAGLLQHQLSSHSLVGPNQEQQFGLLHLRH